MTKHELVMRDLNGRAIYRGDQIVELDFTDAYRLVRYPAGDWVIESRKEAYSPDGVEIPAWEPITNSFHGELRTYRTEAAALASVRRHVLGYGPRRGRPAGGAPDGE